MGDKKTTLSKEIEDTKDCSDFAESGEPCPIVTGKKRKTRRHPLNYTMACAAFAEAGETCPIKPEKKGPDLIPETIKEVTSINHNH